MLGLDGKADREKQATMYNALRFDAPARKLAIQLPLSHISAQIDHKEALMSNLALEWVTISEGAFGKRIVILGDNVAVVSAFTKGRSSSSALQAPCKRAAAYELAADLHLYHCWIPTAMNPADAPSRKYE